MLANAELAQDFFILNQQYKRLVSGLLDILDISPDRLTLDATEDAAMAGMDADKMYFVESVSLSALYRSRTVYLLDEGDLLLPDIAGADDHEVAVSFSSRTIQNFQRH